MVHKIKQMLKTRDTIRILVEEFKGENNDILQEDLYFVVEARTRRPIEMVKI